MKDETTVIEPEVQQRPAAEPPSEDQKNMLTAAKGGSITFLGQVIQFAATFGFTILVTRFLGAENFGVFQLGTNVVTIVAMVSLLGLHGGMMRFIPLARTENNAARLWGFIQIGTAIPTLLSLVLTALLMLFAEPISATVFKTPALAAVLRIGCLAIPLIVLMNCFAAIVTGFKRVEYEVYGLMIAQNGLKLIFALAVLFLGMGVLGVMWAFVAAVGLSAVLLLYFVNKTFPLKRSLRSAQRNVREMFNFSFPLYLSKLLNQFGRRFETLVLGFFGLIAEVGIFAAILRLSALGNMVSNSLRHISIPIIAELHSQNRKTELKRFYQTITKWSLSLNLPIFLTVVIFSDSLLAIFGTEFTVGATALVILAISYLFNASTGICGTVINTTGYTKLGFYNSLAYLITTLVLDFTLIPKWNLLGAALAGGLTIIIINSLRLVQVYVLIDRMLPINRTFVKPAAAAVIAGGLVLILSRNVWVEQTLLQLLVLIPTLWLLYGCLIFVFGLTDEDRTVLRKLGKRFRRKMSSKKR